MRLKGRPCAGRTPSPNRSHPPHMSDQKIPELLAGVAVDEAKRAALRAKAEPAARRHVIFFTPRSGSSWLTAALRATGGLGDANEYFNPAFVANIGRRMQANTLSDYIDAILRDKQTPNGVFTMEITYFQFIRIGDTETFLQYFAPDAPTVVLIRENIVAQAISLYKAVETSVFHANTATEEGIERSAEFDAYDGEKIWGWIDHIRRQELGQEYVFRLHGMAPLRLTYEGMFAPRADPVGAIANHFGVSLGEPVGENPHRPLASPTNRALEERFRREYPERIAELAKERRPLLAQSRPEAFGWLTRAKWRAERALSGMRAGAK